MRVFLTVENEGSDSELEQFVVNLVNADSFDHRNLKKLNAVLVAKLLSLLCGHLPTALRRFYTCHDVCRVQIRIFRTFTEIIDVPLGFRRPRWILVNVTFVSDHKDGRSLRRSVGGYLIQLILTLSEAPDIAHVVHQNKAGRALEVGCANSDSCHSCIAENSHRTRLCFQSVKVHPFARRVCSCEPIFDLV